MTPERTELTDRRFLDRESSQLGFATSISRIFQHRSDVRGRGERCHWLRRYGVYRRGGLQERKPNRAVRRPRSARRQLKDRPVFRRVAEDRRDGGVVLADEFGY